MSRRRGRGRGRDRGHDRGRARGRKKRDSGERFVDGQLQHHGNFAFLLSEDPEASDVYLKGQSLRKALDGDRVRVKLLPHQGRGRPEGHIVEVLERARKTAVGLMNRAGKRWVVVPEEGAEIRVIGFGKGVKPMAGAMAVVKIVQWPTDKAGAAGNVIEVLGKPGEPRVRATAVLRNRELPERFPEEVLRESGGFPDRVSKSAQKGRLKLFDVPLFTIDGADAKDFDDAVSLQELGGGSVRLGVHIADVSQYVRPGTALDREAYKRATSVYLPDRTVPMLPPNLSDHLCSLMPHVERLAVSCFIDLDQRRRVVGCRLADSVIRSWHRFTYEEVERILLGARPHALPKAVVNTVVAMGDLAKRLTALRMKRGALDFDMPEYKVEVDAAGVPVSVKRRDRLDSHRLIEEFMILANEAVARRLIKDNVRSLHRVHPRPDPRKLEALARELEKLDVKVPGNLSAVDGSGLRTLLKRAKGHPLRDTLTVLTVRSLKQAVYSATPAAHFGLASKAYAHFTSPIRRYPDLLVHRAVKSILHKGRGGHGRVKIDLVAAATHCSTRERLADDAERKAVDILRAELVKEERGQIYDGVVTKPMPYGAFVELQDLGATGLLKGVRASMGAKVRVRISKVDLEKGEIDLALVGRRH